MVALVTLFLGVVLIAGGLAACGSRKSVLLTRSVPAWQTEDGYFVGNEREADRTLAKGERLAFVALVPGKAWGCFELIDARGHTFFITTQRVFESDSAD